jgi:translation initiation factor IF-2
MSDIKVSELAKQIGFAVKPLIDVLKDLGIEVENASSTIDDATAELVKEIIEKDHSRIIEVAGSISVRELAEAMNVAPADVQAKLLEMGIMATLNQQIDVDVAALVAKKWGYRVVPAKKEPKPVAKGPVEHKPKPKHSSKAVPKPPVVVVMGHVDHGKTTLLDKIRESNITAGEFGGITQHIGAYQVDVGGRKITFLDTPGHQAFTAMRARGASVTDIVVLVVAADDAIMPQTDEAINHARAAGVPIIVAINKIDKPEANVDRVKQQLAERGLTPEDWGGDTITVELSAKQGTNVDVLLEMILLVADMLELEASASAKDVQGTIIEAKLDRGRGPVATVLVQQGTLKVGTPVVAGAAYGKVKAMFNENGERVFKAGPATPVEILGLSQPPAAGDVLRSVRDEKEAKRLAEERERKDRESRLASQSRLTLEDLHKRMIEGEVKELNLIIKADVQGSEEAVRQALEEIEHEEVRVKIIHSAIGAVNESDIMLAAASDAIVIGFNVRVEPRAADMAEAEHVEIRLYNVIYELINDVRAAMAGLLSPVYEERHLGTAEVRATFRVPKVGVIAGCYVTEGSIVRGANARVKRGDEVIYEGKIDQLKHLKEDRSEIAAGFECGINIGGFNDYEVGDMIDVYTLDRIARAL